MEEKSSEGISWIWKRDLYLDAINMTRNILGIKSSKKETMSVEEYEKKYASKIGAVPEYESTGHISVKKPWYKRKSARKAFYWSRRAVFLGAAASIAGLMQFREYNLSKNQEKVTNLIQTQQPSLERFLASNEFDIFSREFSDQMVMAINYVSQEPFEAYAKLPKVVEKDKSTGQLPWPLEVRPMLDKSYNLQELVNREREIFKKLGKRGEYFDEPKREIVRKMVIASASTTANNYLKTNPADNFSAINLHEPFQKIFLTELAKKYGENVSQYDLIRMGLIYDTFFQHAGNERNKTFRDKLPHIK